MIVYQLLLVSLLGLAQANESRTTMVTCLLENKECGCSITIRTKTDLTDAQQLCLEDCAVVWENCIAGKGLALTGDPTVLIPAIAASVPAVVQTACLRKEFPLLLEEDDGALVAEITNDQAGIKRSLNRCSRLQFDAVQEEWPVPEVVDLVRNAKVESKFSCARTHHNCPSGTTYRTQSEKRACRMSYDAWIECLQQESVKSLVTFDEFRGILYFMNKKDEQWSLVGLCLHKQRQQCSCGAPQTPASAQQIDCFQKCSRALEQCAELHGITDFQQLISQQMNSTEPLKQLFCNSVINNVFH